jgi:hypothetical protein
VARWAATALELNPNALLDLKKKKRTHGGET